MSRVSTVSLLLLLIVAEHQVSPFIGMIGDMATVSNFANDALAFVNGDLPLENLIMGSTGHAINTIIDKMGELTETLAEMERSNERRMNQILETLINRLPLEQRVETGLSELHHGIVRIDALYEHYKDYSRNPDGYHNTTINNFIQSIISHNTGDLKNVLESMHGLMAPARSGKYRKPLLELVHEKNLLLSFRELCGTGTSPQQRLYEIYQSVLISESKVYLMSIFSYAMLTAYKNASFAGEMRKAGVNLVRRVHDYLNVAKEVMEKSSLAADLCDPAQYERGKNFVELEKAMQMFVTTEAELGSRGSCSSSCPKFNVGGLNSGINERCERNDNNWCPLQSCYGRIFDCSTGNTTTVCEMPSTSLARYAWVKDSSGNTYGNSNSCPGRVRQPHYYRTSSGSCDICICTCADELGYSKANRTINLRPQLSNIEANMVVTGVRFISSDKMIQIQIREGEILSDGRINTNNERWVEPERFIYLPNEGYRGRRIGSFNRVTTEQKKYLIHGKDFTFITYYQRSINLDDLKAPDGYILTGVKFQREGNDNDGLSRRPLQLAIRVTKFDFTDGTLYKDDESSHWISWENMPDLPPNYGSRSRRPELDLSNPDSPTNVHGHVQESEPGQIARLSTSDRIKDAGQSTIPFFDGQQATTSMKFPLSGLGLIHRGAPGSGGFFAFRLFTLDLPKYINTTLSQEMIKQLDPNSSDKLS